MGGPVRSAAKQALITPWESPPVREQGLAGVCMSYRRPTYEEPVRDGRETQGRREAESIALPRALQGNWSLPSSGSLSAACDHGYPASRFHPLRRRLPLSRQALMSLGNRPSKKLSAMRPTRMAMAMRRRARNTFDHSASRTDSKRRLYGIAVNKRLRGQSEADPWARHPGPWAFTREALGALACV